MATPTSAQIVVIGGGIAGLSTAWQLAARGARPVLLEREPLFAAHASGRNAAIFRQVDRDLIGARLAQRSLELMAQLGDDAYLARTGAVYVGDARRLGALADLAARAAVRCELLEGPALHRRAPALEGGQCATGLFFEGDGVLDAHALTGALARAATARGAQLRAGVGVEALLLKEGKLEGVVLDSGEELRCPRVVVAAGAWTSLLGRDAGLPMPIEPRRRHLALLLPERGKPAGPVVWRVDEEVYFRPESGGYLASPCDEQAWPAGTPATSAEALSELASRLSRLAPELAGLSVRTFWACLRSFAPDGGLVAGADSRVDGLTWIAGLGGRGMSCGLGLGEVAAQAALGSPHPFAELSPARLLG